MKKLLVVVLALFAACKKSGVQPPPIAQGKCLVDKYVGAQAMQQGCQFEGYSWACTYDEKTLVNTCNRGAEANSERPPTVAPQPMPAALVVPTDAAAVLVD